MAQQTCKVVKALTPFDYRGCPVVPPDVCVVEPIEAAALVYQGRAAFLDDTEAHGVYRRRDLVADAPQPTRRTRTRRRVA